MEILRLCDIVRETSFAIPCYHATGISKKFTRTHWHTGWANSVCVSSSSILYRFMTKTERYLAIITPIYILKSVWLSNSKPAGHCVVSILHNY